MNVWNVRFSAQRYLVVKKTTLHSNIVEECSTQIDHIIPHLQEFTRCHYICSTVMQHYVVHASRVTCWHFSMYIFCFCYLNVVVNHFFSLNNILGAQCTRMYKIYYCICLRIYLPSHPILFTLSMRYGISLSHSTVFYTPFIV